MYMKKKIFSLLVLLVAAVTGAWADIIPTYDLKVGTNDHGTVKFYVGQNEVTTAKEGQTVTVVITPSDGWAVNRPTGQWYAAVAKTPRRAPADNPGLLNAFELTKLQSQDNTWSFVMERANAEISVSYKKLLNSADITIDDIPDQTYAGQDLKPDVTVKDNGTELVKGTDYSVIYGSNYNAGTGTVTITGIGDNYSGTTTKDFVINAAESKVLFYPWTYEKTFYDEDFIIEPFVNGDGAVSYSSNDEDIATVDSETGLVHITGTGVVKIYASVGATNNYTSASDYYELTVLPATLTLDEEDDNTEALGDADGRQRDVTLKRTLQAGGWNTLALPFALSANQIAAVFGSGAKVKTFTGSSLSGSTLTLDFADAQAIEAGKPYLVKVSEDVDLSTVSVEGVTVSAEAVAVETASVDFIPTLGSTTITGSTTKSVLFLAAGNNLLNPTSLPADIKGFRAYFQLKGAAAAARAFSLNLGDGEPLSISPVGERTDAFTLNGNGIRYTLDGRKVNGQPKNGVYIQNGRKVVK
jgi:hypothetical protein